MTTQTQTQAQRLKAKADDLGMFDDYTALQLCTGYEIDEQKTTYHFADGSTLIETGNEIIDK